jgi:hypothetical protein
MIALVECYFIELLDESVGQPGTVRTRKKVRWDPSVGNPSRQSYVTSYSQHVKERQSYVTSYSQLVKKWLFQNC